MLMLMLDYTHDMVDQNRQQVINGVGVITMKHSHQKCYQKLINTEWKPTSYFDSLTSNFAYPVISPHRDKIVKKLQENKVEVRPMICGSMGIQPFYVKHYGKLELPNVSLIDRDGFYVPNHPKLTVDEIAFITEIINGEISE